ncbi:MAG: hypothetical protein R3B92_02515 [Patescibacteria group bacterium]
MDIQVLLIFILSLLTFNLLFVGFYAIMVLKEFRSTVKKANSILEDASKVSHLVSNPAQILHGFTGALSEGIKTINSIKSLRGGGDDD